MTSSRTIRQWLNDDIKYARTDCIMLLLTFGSAMVDTMTVPTLRVFVANNTGNLLLLGLGAAGLGKVYPDLVFADRAGVALVGSWIGSFLTGRIARWCGTKKRFWIISELAFEAFLILLSAILLYSNAVTLEGGTNLILIFLLGWSFGAQSVATKFFGVPTIQVQVVTGAMGDLLSDPNLFVGLTQNKARNQRAVFILTFFLGAVVGGLILVKSSSELVLIITAVFKFLGAAAFLFVPGHVEPQLPTVSSSPSPILEEKEKISSV